MGYNLMAYAIKLDVLRRTAGSKDEIFLKNVRRPMEYVEDDAKTSDECNRQLIMGLEEGESHESSRAHRYFYVLESSCVAFGSPLPN